MLVINGLEVADPPGFLPSTENETENNMVNGNGQEIGDFVRTRDTLSLTWDFLPFGLVEQLIAATNPLQYPEFIVEYDSLSGRKSGLFRVKTPLKGEKIDHIPGRGAVWGSISLTLREV